MLSLRDVSEIMQQRGIDLGEGFKVLPRRWVVERTFAWFNKFRRLSKDYEFNTDTSETMLWVAMLNILIRRVAKYEQ